MKSWNILSVLAANIRGWTRFLPVVLVILAIPLSSFDDRDLLEKKKAKLLKEIAHTRSILSDTRNKREASMAEVSLLRKQVNARQNLVRTMTNQVQLLNRSIRKTEERVEELEAEVKKYKKEYADLVYFSYVNHTSGNELSFIFAAEDFNESFRRAQYNREFSKYRKLQMENIKENKTELEARIRQIETERADKVDLLKEQENQLKALESEKQVIDQKVAELRKQEGTLKAELAKQEKAKNELDKQIKKLIEAEIRKRTATVKKDPKKNNPKYKSLTPSDIKLSKAFSDNKAKLPWPVEKGVVCRAFGKQLHPVLRNPPVYENNNGIDICTDKGATVKSVFKGKVVSVFSHPTFQRGILISHGKYFTVYANLSDVHVSAGQEVMARTSLGKAYTDSETGDTKLHFELWQGTTKLNPASWLYK